MEGISKEQIKWPFVIRQSLAVKLFLLLPAIVGISAWNDPTAAWQLKTIGLIFGIALANAFFYRVEVTPQFIRKRSLFCLRTIPVPYIETFRVFAPRSPKTPCCKDGRSCADLPDISATQSLVQPIR